MEVHLDVPDGFIFGLLKEGDDWTFVLRLHALVEASLDYLVVAALDSKLADWATRHNISGRTGKIALGSHLGLLDEPDVAMLEGLTEIRNRFAHRVQMTGVDLVAYATSLSPGEGNKLVRWIQRAHGYAPSKELDAATNDAWRTAARLVLWVACRPLIERATELRRSARGTEIDEAFGLATEDGLLFTTEAGDVIVREDAPDIDARPRHESPRTGPPNERCN